MAKFRNHGGFKKGGSRGMLRCIIEKLLTSTLPSSSPRGGGTAKVGHFVVIATGGWTPERFVVDLDYLNNQEFLKLLKQAEEEFGFSQEGALAVPCRPDELLRVLQS